MLIKPNKTHIPRILALDLMSVVGWACRADDGEVMYGTETFETKQSHDLGMKWLRFRNWLKRMRLEIKPEFIYYEQVVGFPPKNRGRDSKIFHGFEATLTAVCEAADLRRQGVPVGTIKKFIAGAGNAPKEAIVNAVKVLGYNPANHNEADAIALLLLAEELIEA